VFSSKIQLKDNRQEGNTYNLNYGIFVADIFFMALQVSIFCLFLLEKVQIEKNRFDKLPGKG